MVHPYCTVFLCALLLSSYVHVHASSCAAAGCASENKKGNAMLQKTKISKIDEDALSEALVSQQLSGSPSQCPPREGCSANDDSNCTVLGIECNATMRCCVPPPEPPALLEASSGKTSPGEDPVDVIKSAMSLGSVNNSGGYPPIITQTCPYNWGTYCNTDYVIVKRTRYGPVTVNSRRFYYDCCNGWCYTTPVWYRC